MKSYRKFDDAFKLAKRNRRVFAKSVNRPMVVNRPTEGSMTLNGAHWTLTGTKAVLVYDKTQTE